MLWSKGSYIITVTSFNGIFESDKSESIIIVVELPSGNEGYAIPGYNFTLFPAILLGLAILLFKIYNKNNKNNPNQ